MTVRRRVNTTRKSIRLTDDGRAKIQAWADEQGVSFSAAIESLALLGLGEDAAVAFAPLMVSAVRFEVQRQMNRLATIAARGAIESGAAAILANEALAAMRPRSSEQKKEELERARGIGYKRLRRPLEEIVEEQKQRKREMEREREG
jgi:DNA-binding MarR family transcriptional regulator